MSFPQIERPKLGDAAMAQHQADELKKAVGA